MRGSEKLDFFSFFFLSAWARVPYREKLGLKSFCLYLQNSFASYSQQQLLTTLEMQRLEISRLEEEDRVKTKKLEILTRALKNHMSLKRRYNYVRSSYERLQQKYKTCQQSLRAKFSRLHEDQIQALTSKSPRGLKWGPKSKRDGLVLEMRCGTVGNSAVVQKLPLHPSVRSLQSYVQFMEFESGCIGEMFDLIEVASKDFNVFEK